MAHMAHQEIIDKSMGDGNNNTSPAHIEDMLNFSENLDMVNGKKIRNFFFTFNNYEFKDIGSLAQWFLALKVSKYVFQEEIGESGTPHLQGCISFKNQHSYSWQKDKFSEKGGKYIHWMNVRNLEAAEAYCQKDDSRKIGTKPYKFGHPEDLEIIEVFTEWQLKLIEELKQKPHKRKIIWYVDTVGGTGKSDITRYLSIKHGAVMQSGSATDIKHMIASRVLDNGKKGWKPLPVKIIIWDLPRSSCKNDKCFISYGGLEQIKNGSFCSTKYEGAMVHINPPHIVVMANVYPDKSQLSEDRWDIRVLDKPTFKPSYNISCSKDDSCI